MHREFKKLLKGATGVSEYVIAVNLDVRGFSEFSKQVESPDTAMFVKKVYTRLIDEYFENASFFKPTGDGLLLIIPYNEKNLQSVATSTISSCLKVLKDFCVFCSNDPMLNFDVPTKVGIGLSRGTACRLISENKILDYSGRALNLASRLMDLARPTGIVFDAEFGIELLSEKQAELFVKDSVYIRGIAEREPIEIYYTNNSISISPLSKRALEKIKWNTIKDTKTLKQIKDCSPTFLYGLETEPIDPKEIIFKVTHPYVLKGRKTNKIVSTFKFNDFEYFLETGKPRLRVQFEALVMRLEANKVKNSWEVTIEIMYPES